MTQSSESNHRLVYQACRHIPHLDGVRGLAILLVTLYRFGREAPDSSLGVWMPQIIGIGAHGVELFFVLSGFLITGILLDSRGSRHQLRNFFVRRSLRILPLYFASLALLVGLIPQLAHMWGATSIERAFAPAREQQFFLWFYLTNVQMAQLDAWCFGPLDHFWSLAVEEHFYWIWPLAILLLSSRRLMWTTLIATAVCIATRTLWLAMGGAATAAEVLTVWRCDGLLMGALMAMLIRSSESTWQRVIAITRWAWLPAIGLALAIDLADRRVLMLHSTLWNAVWFCLLANMLSSRQDGWLARLFDRAWLRGLGQISYGMYVFQAPLIPLAAALGWTAGVSLPMNFLYVGVMFAVCVVVAWCSWMGFERHWLRLKEYFPQRDTMAVDRAKTECPKTAWGLARPAR